MNTDRWIARFRRNRLNRPEPDWDAPIVLPQDVIARLVCSLEQFRLGDGGGPACLIAFDAERFRTGDMAQLVDLWFAGEKEHSRLLGAAVQRFGGREIAGHWSFTVFCWVRRRFGVRFELTVLLLTEIVSTIYYGLMRRHGDDAALRAMCELIIRDEIGHVAFHRARLAAQNRRFGRIWEWRFRVLGFAAGTMLWINHARALNALGATTAEFYIGINREMSRFVARLRRDTAAIASLPVGQLCRV